MVNVDVRWQQRMLSYKKALGLLVKFIEKGELNELEEQGLIKAFEYAYDLAWNVLKDFLADRGNKNIYGSSDAIREAFSVGLIEDGEGWMEMYFDRNKRPTPITKRLPMRSCATFFSVTSLCSWRCGTKWSL